MPLIVKGLVALLLKLYSNRTPLEILSSEPSFIDGIGLRQHLSPTRFKWSPGNGKTDENCMRWPMRKFQQKTTNKKWTPG